MTKKPAPIFLADIPYRAKLKAVAIAFFAEDYGIDPMYPFKTWQEQAVELEHSGGAGFVTGEFDSEPEYYFQFLAGGWDE